MTIAVAPWMAPGGAEDAMSDLSLRFPMFGGHLTFWAYVFPCFWASGRSRLTPVQPNRPRPSLGPPPLRAFCAVLGPGREPLRRVQGPLFLIQYTCSLILDLRHLILDTCTWYLYLYTWYLILVLILDTCTYTLDTWYLYLYLIPVLIHLILEPWSGPLQPCDPQGVRRIL